METFSALRKQKQIWTCQHRRSCRRDIWISRPPDLDIYNLDSASPTTLQRLKGEQKLSKLSKQVERKGEHFPNCHNVLKHLRNVSIIIFYLYNKIEWHHVQEEIKVTVCNNIIFSSSTTTCCLLHLLNIWSHWSYWRMAYHIITVQ